MGAAAQRQWLSSQQTLLTTALRDREAAAAELVKVNQQKNAWLVQLQAASARDRDANALLAEHTAEIVAASALASHVAQPGASPIESGTASLVGDTEVSAGWVPIKIDVQEQTRNLADEIAQLNVEIDSAEGELTELDRVNGPNGNQDEFDELLARTAELEDTCLELEQRRTDLETKVAAAQESIRRLRIGCPCCEHCREKTRRLLPTS